MAITFQKISDRLTRVTKDGQKVGHITKLENGLYEVTRYNAQRGAAPLAHEATMKAAQKAARMHFA